MGSGTSHNAQFWGFHCPEEGSQTASEEELPFLTSGGTLSFPFHISHLLFPGPAGLSSSPDNKKVQATLLSGQRQSHGLPK